MEPCVGHLAVCALAAMVERTLAVPPTFTLAVKPLQVVMVVVAVGSANQ